MMTMLKLFIATLFTLFHTMSSAVTLGQISIFDPNSGSRTIVYKKMGGYGVVEGDILIGKLTELTASPAVIRKKIGGSKWSNGLVPFEMAENLPLMNKLAVLKAISHMQQHTAVQFIEITSKNRSQYPDYILFVPAEGTTCSSFVGKQGGMQEIQLSPRCTDMNTVHEIGHALGLWHEQSRADRVNYIRILWENIDENHRYNFDQHLKDGQDIGEYDYYSIMHYGPYAFSKNGEKTIIPLVDGVDIGQRNHLSEKDIAAIKEVYPP